MFPAALNRLYFIELEHDEGLAPHRVRQVYLTGTREPTTKVDVTPYIETRIRALREHQSQIKDMDQMAERLRSFTDPEAPAEAPRYMDSFRVINL